LFFFFFYVHQLILSFSHNSEERLSIEQIRKSTYFWSFSDREVKISAFHASKDKEFLNSVLLKSPNFPNWHKKVPPSIFNSVRSFDPATGTGLITFIRHGLQHSRDWDK
jgi:hypothetical protein